MALAAMCLACIFDKAARADLLPAGEEFPAWELTDQASRPVSSKSLAGKRYLLWFYPKAMTPGCTAEGRGLRDEYEEFRKQDVEILGVSFDTPEENARFVAAEGFPFRLLSDTDRSLAVRVGAASSPAQAVPRRISYLVGPDGKVIEAFASVDPESHAEEVLGKVRGAASTPAQ
jgi:peroxiredoxin Q/BCP